MGLLGVHGYEGLCHGYCLGHNPLKLNLKVMLCIHYSTEKNLRIVIISKRSDMHKAPPYAFSNVPDENIIATLISRKCKYTFANISYDLLKNRH